MSVLRSRDLAGHEQAGGLTLFPTQTEQSFTVPEHESHLKLQESHVAVLRSKVCSGQAHDGVPTLFPAQAVHVVVVPLQDEHCAAQSKWKKKNCGCFWMLSAKMLAN